MRHADCRAPVAVFDSGLGGISVLRELVRTLPRENYLYFGDSLHAPYGTKTPQEVVDLSLQAADRLLSQGAKALVVACNTATSAAIRTLRKTYPDLSIVGTEPAIKPAVERHPGGRILMLATAMTVQEEKFQRLKAQYDDQAQIIPIACSGLMEYVEQGILRGAEVEGYLLDKLEPYLKVPIDAGRSGLHALSVFAPGPSAASWDEGPRSSTEASASPGSLSAGSRSRDFSTQTTCPAR